MTYLNWLAPITLSALAMFAIGALWYSPFLFGKLWQKEAGISEEDIKKSSMAMTFGLSFVMMLVMATGITTVIYALGGVPWQTGLNLGLYIALFVVCTSMGINYIYQKKSLKLWLVDAGYQTIGICIMTSISVAWEHLAFGV